MTGRNCHALRTSVAAGWAVALFLTIGLGGASAGTRLIAHFENDNNADPWGRDVLRDFYSSQGAGVDVNLYPNVLGTNNLLPFPLVSAPPFYSGGTLPGDPFEIHQYAADGSVPTAGMVGENRFAAFGSGWSLGAQDQVQDFQINFISVVNEDDDVNYRPGPPGLAQFLDNNVVTGTVQDWSSYNELCFYLCINAPDIPSAQFFDNFKVQLWEYWVEVQVTGPPGPPWTVLHNEREIYEVSLSEILSQNGVGRFTGWRHLRVPLSSFHRVDWTNTYWRYANFVSEEAFSGDGLNPGMDNTLNTDHIRAIIFRKDQVVPGIDPTDTRITVAIDEIAVTGDTTAQVLRVNIPGALEKNPGGEIRCEDTQDRGLCWAQLFADDPDQARPYRNPVRPPTGANRNVDVVASVRDWQQFWATFSAEVGNGAVVADNNISSEIVFVPQFQAPGTWVQRWLVGPDFLRRKGTISIPAVRQSLFYTDWRYDYTNGNAAENYLVRYNPLGATPLARLDPSAQPRGGFLANCLRDPQLGYAYGTLWVLPRDMNGNIGRAWVIDVLFEKPSPAPEFRDDQRITGRP